MGAGPAARVFQGRLERTRLDAEKCVVDYGRRRQPPHTLMVMTVPALPRPRVAVASVSSPKPSPLTKDRARRENIPRTGWRCASPRLELHTPLAVLSAGLSLPPAVPAVIQDWVSADPQLHFPSRRALPVLAQHRGSLLRALQPRLLRQPLRRAL